MAECAGGAFAENQRVARLVSCATAVSQADLAVCGGGDLGAVGHDQDGGACCGVIAQQFEDALGGYIVEFTGRFVGEQHPRVVGQRDGETGARQLAARELRGRACARAVSPQRSSSGRASRA